MTIFKAFLQILNRNKIILILYSVILIFFAIFNTQNSDIATNFESVKPDLHIINHDTEQGITGSLVKYLGEQNNIVELADDAESVDDALFYRKVNYVVEIPGNFRADFLAGKNPEITTRSTGDYNANLAEMSLTRYLELAKAYRLVDDETGMLADLEKTLATDVEVELARQNPVNGLERAVFYYNFLNYPMLAGGIFMICLMLLSFREQKVARRIMVSSTSPARVNRILILANGLFMLWLWLIYVMVSFVIDFHAMLSVPGLWLVLNSGVFTICVTALAFLLTNLVNNRGAMNGIVNVVALGSSFLCGAFVPLEWLPDAVRNFAHVLPSYWYIDANEKIGQAEEFSWSNLAPILANIAVVLGFSILFVILTNLLKYARRREI